MPDVNLVTLVSKIKMGQPVEFHPLDLSLSRDELKQHTLLDVMALYGRDDLITQDASAISKCAPKVIYAAATVAATTGNTDICLAFIKNNPDDEQLLRTIMVTAFLYDQMQFLEDLRRSDERFRQFFIENQLDIAQNVIKLGGIEAFKHLCGDLDLNKKIKLPDSFRYTNLTGTDPTIGSVLAAVVLQDNRQHPFYLDDSTRHQMLEHLKQKGVDTTFNERRFTRATNATAAISALSLAALITVAALGGPVGWIAATTGLFVFTYYTARAYWDDKKARQQATKEVEKLSHSTASSSETSTHSDPFNINAFEASITQLVPDKAVSTEAQAGMSRSAPAAGAVTSAMGIMGTHAAEPTSSASVSVQEDITPRKASK